MEIKVRKATAEDIELLITLRLDFLREDHGGLCEVDEKTICSQLSGYFSRHLCSCDFVAILAEVDDKIAGCAFLMACEKPANLAFTNGKTGTVLNVLTYPEYRRKGVASSVIAALIDQATIMGLSQLELCASGKGKPLYEKFGFVPPRYTAMRLNLV